MSKYVPTSFCKASLVTCLALLALPASSYGQATRTWVSGVGDDVNPCSRTAPCKTFAGAISKTAAKGEINVLDPGGFGAVTITKAITIDGNNIQAGILSPATNGVIVNAGANDKVVLRELNINGTGNGVDGVRILGAKTTKIVRSRIYGFTQGVNFNPSADQRLIIQDTQIHDNSGNGVMVAPTNSAGIGRVTLRRDDIDDNACGVVGGSFGQSYVEANACGTRLSGTGGTGLISSFHTTISNNPGTAVLSNGVRAANRIKSDEISDNGVGLQRLDGGAILTFGDNYIFGNVFNGTSNGTIPSE